MPDPSQVNNGYAARILRLVQEYLKAKIQQGRTYDSLARVSCALRGFLKYAKGIKRKNGLRQNDKLAQSITEILERYLKRKKLKGQNRP